MSIRFALGCRVGGKVLGGGVELMEGGVFDGWIGRGGSCLQFDWCRAWKSVRIFSNRFLRYVVILLVYTGIMINNKRLGFINRNVHDLT